ncbi:MAG: DUF6090 family protein [Bacteroidota bacterium]
MIRFFRRIRQSLLTENKIGNYILYALGEIALVVIGILIAIAINNLNEQRITQKKEKIYLSGLKEEFQINKAKLQELISINKSIFEAAKKLVEYTSNEAITPSEQQLSDLLYQTFAMDLAYNPNNSLLQEMINSGSLKDISNNKLRKRLTNWLATLDDIAKQEADLAKQRDKVLDLSSSDEYSIRTILDLIGISKESFGLTVKTEHSSNLSLLNSKAFENQLLLFLLTTQSTDQAHYIPLMQELNAILKSIDEALKE